MTIHRRDVLKSSGIVFHDGPRQLSLRLLPVRKIGIFL
jgi:hypothetical protein